MSENTMPVRQSIQIELKEVLDFDGMLVSDVIDCLASLDLKYPKLTFRMEYPGYPYEHVQLYLTYERLETAKEITCRLRREETLRKEKRAMAKRQLQQIKKTFPDLF